MGQLLVLVSTMVAVANGTIAAAFTLPLAERRGWGLRPPRLVRGLREYPHTGTQGLGLFRRAWRAHLLYGLVVGACLPIYLPAVLLLPGGELFVDPGLRFLPAAVPYWGLVWLFYVIVSGSRDGAVLRSVGIGIAAHLGVLVVFANIGYTAASALQTVDPVVLVAAEVGTVIVGGIVAVRAKGFERTMSSLHP